MKSVEEYNNNYRLAHLWHTAGTPACAKNRLVSIQYAYCLKKLALLVHIYINILNKYKNIYILMREEIFIFIYMCMCFGFDVPTVPILVSDCSAKGIHGTGGVPNWETGVPATVPNLSASKEALR
jgi:hypothetical protein